MNRQTAVAPSRPEAGWLPLLLIVLTLAAYWPALQNGFVRWDDQLYVTENPLLNDPDGLWRGWTSLRETERQYYPLLLTTYWIQHRLWGDQPAGYHAVNIWFHTANSMLVLLLVMALGGGRWVAGATALLFALHPIQVESVAWVAELKNLQEGFFYLTAFLCYLYHRSAVPPGASGRGPFLTRRAAYGATVFLYACALFSKTAAITLPLSLFLADWLLVAPRDHHWWKGSLARVAPMLLMGVVPSLVTISLEEGPAPEVIPPLLLRPFVASAALWFYLGKLAAPFSLTPIYPRWDLSAIRFWLLLAATALCGLLVLFWHFRRRVPRLAAWGMGHFVVTLAPVLGFIPFGYLDHSFVADHFVYLAVVGFFLAAAVGLERIADGLAAPGRAGRWIKTGVVGLALVACIGLTRAQIPIWSGQLAFWSYLETANPRSETVHNNLGNAYLRQNRVGEAAGQYRIALRLKPNSSTAHLNLGLVLEQQGHLPQAIEEYRKAVYYQPESWLAHYNLALDLAKTGRPEEAARHAEEAMAVAKRRGRTDAVDTIATWLERQRAGGAAGRSDAATTVEHDHPHMQDDPEMPGLEPRVRINPDELAFQIPLAKTREQRRAFSRDLQQLTSYKKADLLRNVYERYIDVIGANGILETLQGARPTCHWEGHPLGMVIYARLRDLGRSLLTCQDGCNSGCMHGVIMEAFKGEARKGAPRQTRAPDAAPPSVFDRSRTLKERVQRLCDDPGVARLYKKGDCSHGVGHALMNSAGEDVQRAVRQCAFFDQYPMQYYCATGAYMEYVTHHDEQDAQTRSLFYPCDIGDYPAACFRYKMVHVLHRHYASGGSLRAIIDQCVALSGKFRLGCFHGLGNAHMGFLSRGKMALGDVCGFGTDQDQSVCIDGAVERLAKYYPDKARRACEKLSGWRGELCRAAAERNMYSLDKSFEFYVR
jgi:protein O-mannosyl-transferase